MSAVSTTAPAFDEEEADDGTGDAYGVVFWATAAVGGAIVAFGIHGLWATERHGFPSAARWFVGGAVAFDLLLVPLGAMAAWAAKRIVPTWTWPVVRAVLLTSVLLATFAAPLVLDQGGDPGNATIRPRNYRSGLALALAVTWLLGAAALVVLRAGGRPDEPAVDRPAR